MNRRNLVPLLFCALSPAFGLAQKPAPAELPSIDLDAHKPEYVAPSRAVPTIARAPLAGPEHLGKLPEAARESAFEVPTDFVVFDMESDGAIWAAAENYKARFDRRGLGFAPFLGVEAPSTRIVGFRLAAARVGGVAIECAAEPVVTRSERRIELDYGAVIERYDVDARGVEQSFVFERLPARGRLEVEIALDRAGLDGRLDASGAIRLRGMRGGVEYGAAIAIDDRGARVAVETRLENDRIVHSVPADFVARAVFPLVVDPLISSLGTIASGAMDYERADVGYEPTTDTYCVVWQRVFSATDRDIYVSHFGADASPRIGSFAGLALTAEDYVAPSVAGRAIGREFLVAVSALLSGQSETVIRVRTRGADGSFANGVWTTVSGTERGSKFEPDVGGDYNPIGPTYWNVVWTRRFSATDHDVHFRLIGNNAVANGGVQYADNSLANDSGAAVSESCGSESASTQNWCLVWNRASGSPDVYGRTVRWDGMPTRLTFPIDTRGEHSGRPDVSSISRSFGGDRWFVVASSSFSFAEVDCTLIGLAGGVGSRVEIQSARDEFRNPSVDCDGQRFIVACERDFVCLRDPDIAAWSFGIDPSGTPELVLLEQQVTLASSSSDERRADVASRYGDPGPVRPFEALCVWDDAGLGSQVTTMLEGSLFSARQALNFQELAYGCGTIDLAVASLYHPGSDLIVRVTNATGPHGVLVGVPYPVPVPCGPCTLGVQGTSFGSPLRFTIPLNASLVGSVAAAQGFKLSGGPCVGAVQLTNMKRFTVR